MQNASFLASTDIILNIESYLQVEFESQEERTKLNLMKFKGHVSRMRLASSAPFPSLVPRLSRGKKADNYSKKLTQYTPSIEHTS